MVTCRTLLRRLRLIHVAYISFGLSLCLSFDGSAQVANTGAPKTATVHPDVSALTPVKLHYDDPVTFPVGTKQSAIISDFKCGADGSVFLPMVDDVSHLSREAVASSMMIVGLTPSGDVVRFIPQPVSGYRNLISLFRYFVAKSYVYVLELGDKIDSGDLQRVSGRSRIIQAFDYKGQLVQSIVLDADIDPLNFAVFDSGEILVLSADTLNHSTRLLLLDPRGRLESKLSLFDSDFASQLDLAAKGQSRTLSNVLAVSSFVPHGEDILLAATGINFPILELNQHGVVKATKLALPSGLTVRSLLPSDDGMLRVVAGTLRSMPLSTSASGSPPPTGEYLFASEIDEFYPQDGSLVRRISIEPGPKPVCASKDVYTFLAHREADSRLQLITASPSDH